MLVDSDDTQLHNHRLLSVSLCITQCYFVYCPHSIKDSICRTHNESVIGSESVAERTHCSSVDQTDSTAHYHSNEFPYPYSA